MKTRMSEPGRPMLDSMIKPRQLKSSRIPPGWDAVTTDWMAAAIAGDFPEAELSGLRLLTCDDGTNRRARFALDYMSHHGPGSVFLKAHAPGHRLVHLRNGNLFNEARLFRSGVELPVDHPAVYRAMVDYLRLDFLLVMEDLALRGADPRDATRPLTVEQVANGLRGLARLHAHYWGGPSGFRPLRWVKTWKPARGWQLGLRKRIPLGLARGRDLLPTGVLQRDANSIVELWSRYVGTLSRGAMTLLHGDAHIGNTYVLPDGDVGFLDWQVVRWGNWSQDVGYFVMGALTPADRRSSEMELLAIYRDALLQAQVDCPPADIMWRHYCSSAAYGLGIWLSTLGTDGWQSREISEALAQRYAVAFEELDSESVLGKMGA